MQPLRIVDFNSMFSFSGGGIRTYHMRKLAYFAGRDDVAYSMIAPSDRDGVEEHGHARLYHVKTPPLLRVRNYSLIIEPRKPQVTQKDAININFGNELNYMNTQLQLLQNHELMKKVPAEFREE